MTLTDDEKKFMDAAGNGDLETIKELISSEKISLDNHDEIKHEFSGGTALQFASANGHLEIVRFFLEGENSVTLDGEADSTGYTALHDASDQGHLDIMKFLISKGANVNQQDEDGQTSLHHAAFHGIVPAVKLLLEMGADPTIRDNRNENAVDYSHRRRKFTQQQKYANVVKAIEQHIQRPQQIEELIRWNDILPIAIWPNAISRLESVNFIHKLLSQTPFLFQEVQEETDQKT